MSRRPSRAGSSPGRSGVLVVDKGAGVTSFGVVAMVRRVLRAPRIGHGGTLDPDATGVLPILIGEATKLVPYLVEHEKEYRAVVQLGLTTDTHDLAGRVLERRPVPGLTRGEIERAAAVFVGSILQVPPMYSALHHEGQRLYDLARRGVEVERAPRTVVVRAVDVEAVELPRVTLRIVCGKGTYVRVLAADLGARLGVGGAVERLVRTRVGTLTLADAVPWSDVVDGRAETIWPRVLAPDAVLTDTGRIDLDAVSTVRVRHGNSVDATAISPGLFRLYGADGAFLGVGRSAAGRVKPERLLHADQPGTRVVPG
jgi:tRNA pseudouridine55 synthase